MQPAYSKMDVAPKRTGLGDLVDRYTPSIHFDEVVNDDGLLRDHYAKVFEQLKNLDAHELKRREALKDSLFRTQGITFTVYGDPEQTERTFPLDLLPRIISGDEWQQVEAGVTQRVQALNLFLEDIYCGDQAIINDRVIPRKLIESAQGYQPEALGIPVPHAARCLVAGIDLIRNEAGEYLVLEDNLRNPSGVSYVLENRSAMTRVMPQVFNSAQPRPVNHYPTMLLEALQSVAHRPGKRPRVVLLTPGRFNSAYFEHSCLARLMGVILVEAQDLVVQDEIVHVRTTKGLERVDVIYRRIDDDFLDPDVFRADSLLGVPGVVNAARKRNVTICNAIGNGIADDKAVYAYVPKIVEYYLGERPTLNNIKTYLLHNPDEQKEALKRIDELVIKPVGGSGGYGLVFGPHATDSELEDCRKAVLENPRNFVAQEIVNFSMHPTMIGSDLKSRHIDFRPFVVSGKQTEVLPGGLTRVALPEGSIVVNSSQGGGSKDTWVTTPGPEQRSVKPTKKPQTLANPQQDLILTSTGENLFWIGRYLERAKNTAHLLDVTYHSAIEEDPDSTVIMLRELLETLLLEDEYEEAGHPYTSDAIVHFLVSERDNPGSIRSAIQTARRNARQVQEKVSVEFWEALNDLHLQLTDFDLALQLSDYPFEMFTDIWRKCSMTSGVLDDTMSHNDAWRFVEIGRQTERALLTARMLGVFLPDLQSTEQSMAFNRWITVLRSAGAYQEYRKLFQASLDPAHTMMFLLQAEEFPRSVAHCLRKCTAALDGLDPRFDQATDLTEQARLQLISIADMLDSTDLRMQSASSFSSLVETMVDGLESFSDDFQLGFFAPVAD